MVTRREDAGSLQPELRRTRQMLKQARSDLRQAREEVRETERQLKQANRRNENIRQRFRQVNQQLRSTAREYLLCKAPENAVCAEIGVHEGEFSRQIFETVRPSILHLIDPWLKGEGLFGNQEVGEQAVADGRHAKVEEHFTEEIEANRVQIHRNLSSEVVGDFEDSYFDWIYIDGNHLYEYVKQDLELYYPKVKDGGYICGDDYGTQGYWENGIQRAVDEFTEKSSELTLEVKGTQFIIRKENTA
jgi:hypothetical protein